MVCPRLDSGSERLAAACLALQQASWHHPAADQVCLTAAACVRQAQVVEQFLRQPIAERHRVSLTDSQLW